MWKTDDAGLTQEQLELLLEQFSDAEPADDELPVEMSALLDKLRQAAQ